MTIIRDENIFGAEPRFDGTRVGVRHIAVGVIESDQSPAYVADQLDLSLSRVYEALSHYSAHIEEMRTLERDNEAAFERVRGSSPIPKKTAQWRVFGFF